MRAQARIDKLNTLIADNASTTMAKSGTSLVETVRQMGNTADKQSASVDTFASAVTDFAGRSSKRRPRRNQPRRIGRCRLWVASDDRPSVGGAFETKALWCRHSAGLPAGNRVLYDGALVNARNADVELADVGQARIQSADVRRARHGCKAHADTVEQ